MVETLGYLNNIVLDGVPFPHGFYAAFAKLPWLLAYVLLRTLWPTLCRWVRDDLERQDANQHHIIADDPVCYRPLYLYNIAVSQVPPYDFTCDHDYYDYYYDNDDSQLYDDFTSYDQTNNASLPETET